MIFIKPWDDEVYQNFFALLSYIQEKSTSESFNMSVIVPPDLHKRFNESSLERVNYGIDMDLETYEGELTDAFRKSIDYIMTLGGDGTILWAAK